MHAFLSLLIVGVGLSQDNFRTSIALGPLHRSWRRRLRTAAAFGFWDGLAPLIGILIGSSGRSLGPAADGAGAVALLGYGLYLVVRSLRSRAVAEPDDPMVLFGMPVSLSLDNLIGGVGLGLLGFSPLLPALLFAAITFVMSLIGLGLGGAASRLAPIRPDLLTGVFLLAMGTVLALGALGVLSTPDVVPGAG
ncbi:MAG TPA: manganese efflux pump [Candidatus Dormibacteraeota bacterium]|nr:manganese efflux pump [Candidatus Dormibacteraeota bacterium]